MKSIDSGAPRTCLLLGGNGFLGRNLATALELAGHRVLIGQRSINRGSPNHALPLADIDAILHTICDERVDCVVHLASALLPSSDEGAYLLELTEVSLPTIRLARELARIGVSLVFFSSGGTVYGRILGENAVEDACCEPISLYGQAKLELELHLAFLARTCGLDLLVLRPSNPYGPHQSLHGAQGLISVVLGRIAGDLPLEIWGDGSVVRDYIHVDDASAIITELIGLRVRGVFNIGSGVGHSLMDVIRLAEKATGRLVELRFRAARPVDVPRLVLDITRLRQLGIDRARPLAKGIRQYAEVLGITNDR